MPSCRQNGSPDETLRRVGARYLRPFRRILAITSNITPAAPQASDLGDSGLSDQDTQTLATRLKAFGEPIRKRSIGQLLITALAFALLWSGMWFSLDFGYWITLLLAIPAGGLVVRFFIIQHDCGHGSFFRSRRANDLLGRVIGVLTLTPYDYWRSTHAVHHATSGNLDRRGIGDIDVLTVDEFRALSRWRRLGYRLYRHPLVMFGLGPTYLFILKHRLPLELPLRKTGLWVSVLATNLAIVGLTVAMAFVIGPIDLLKLQLPVVLLSSSIGVWLFFVQHQYEGAYWQHDPDWTFHQAALRGSSYYRLPRILQWFTASIGLHHIHHLCSKIPNYRLQECLDRFPELARINRLTLASSLRCARLALWDEKTGKMIGFRDLKRAA